MKTARLIISGRVQGVGYRDWLMQQANVLGLHGWVRNLGDHQVEALVHGESEAVARIIEACRRGPHYAAVVDVRSEVADPPAHAGFHRQSSV
jgi:acylphosphatase